MSTQSLFINNIPTELKKYNQWLLYRLIQKPGNDKPTKVPFQSNGQYASSTNPNTWSSFKETITAYQSGKFDGIGFVFSENDPYVGIDLDSCIDGETNKLAPEASKWVENFSSYTELSPSKTGLHIITKGQLQNNKGMKNRKYEIYNHARFFTFTGEHIKSTPNLIKNRQSQIDCFCQNVFPKTVDSLLKTPSVVGHKLINTEIDTLIGKMQSSKNGKKFNALFDGRWEEIKETKFQNETMEIIQKYGSQSEADLGFCVILAFWTNNNPIAIDQIYRQSKLYRQKWERRDYREGTINKAIIKNIERIKSDYETIVGSDPSKKIPIIHISDVQSKPIEYLIDKIWPVNSVGFISGQPGTFKTWFSLEIAICVASGTKLFDEYVCKKGRVLAFNAEDDPGTITRKRVAAFAKHKQLNISEIDLYLLNTNSILLNNKDTQEAFRNTVAEYNPDLIILDPLRNIHSLNEDSATEMMAGLLHFLREINREFSCSILLICHDKKPNKGNNDRAAQVRGTSALTGWRDNTLLFDLNDYLVTVNFYNRAGPSIEPFHFQLKTSQTESGELDTAYFELTNRVKIELQKDCEKSKKIIKIIEEHQPLSRNKILEYAKMNRKKCLTIIKDLLLTGEIQKFDNKTLCISPLYCY